jgi:UDP-2,4-diacetamido-2,4,6-trideoxy-beta-L-altropyranose hydrolase
MGGRALFRCDASSNIGAGHVMRCLAFAEELTWAGWSCAFATHRASAATAPALMASGYRIDEIEADEVSLSVDTATKLVVVDHYQLDSTFERQLAAAGRTIVVFDDLADRPHACDILVDPTPGRCPNDYAPYVSASARLQLGPNNAVIRCGWRAQRARVRGRLAAGPPVERIIVSMGAADPLDASSRVLAALAHSRLDAHLDVVLGAGAPHLARVAERVGPGITLHVDPARLPEIAAQADLAIGASGVSSFERAVLGLPAILIPIAGNQRLVAAAFAAAGAAEVVSSALLDDPASLGTRIALLAADAPRRVAMSKAAASITDGRGAPRLLAAIAGEVATASGVPVRLRLFEPEDQGWLLELQRQAATRRFARNPAVPSAREHAAWFAQMLEDCDRLVAIVEADHRAAGMVRLDKVSNHPVTLDVSVAIDARLHGKGLGSAALTLARRLAPGADLVATILPDNRASLALFAARGYRPDGRDRYRNRAA